MDIFGCLAAPFVACYRALSRDPAHRWQDPVDAHLIREAPAPLVPAKVDKPIKDMKVDNRYIISPTSAMVIMLAGTNMYDSIEIEDGEVDENGECLAVEVVKKDKHVANYMTALGPTITQEFIPFAQGFAEMDAKAFPYAQQCMKTRKIVFNQNIEDAIERTHTKQVLLVADGYNPMVAHLAGKYPDVQFYCTDLNPEITFNRSQLFRILNLPNVHCVTHDATDAASLLPTLKSAGFNEKEYTYATAEGLVYYIPEQAEIDLVKTILGYHKDNVVLLDYIDKNDLENDGYGYIHREVGDLVTRVTGRTNDHRLGSLGMYERHGLDNMVQIGSIPHHYHMYSKLDPGYDRYFFMGYEDSEKVNPDKFLEFRN